MSISGPKAPSGRNLEVQVTLEEAGKLGRQAALRVFNELYINPDLGDDVAYMATKASTNGFRNEINRLIIESQKIGLKK